MKVISIVGARPQFIKVAALQRAFAKEEKIQHLIVHTGQHYDYYLSEIFFKELEIPEPHFHLTAEDTSLAASTNRMTAAIGDILIAEKPDIVMVFGDTNSTVAGALAAKKLHIRIAHAEAGLRSYNMSMPEENNRITTDKISDFLFCPTTRAVNNLAAEGINNDKQTIVLSGDLMLDAINYYSGKGNPNSKLTSLPQDFIVCTFHRHGLVTSPPQLKEVIKALNEINTKTPVVLPAHPRFKNMVSGLGVAIDFAIIEPVGYLDMITLLKRCSMVITDSGGLQKEAFFCKKICITVRNETEWKELVEAGVNFIAGTSCETILGAFDKARKAQGNFNGNFYGDGKSAYLITRTLLDSALR